MGWQWHQLDHVQISFAPRSRQITTPVPYHSFLQARCPSCHPTNSVKALKAKGLVYNFVKWYTSGEMAYGLQHHFLESSKMAIKEVECTVCRLMADLTTVAGSFSDALSDRRQVVLGDKHLT